MALEWVSDDWQEECHSPMRHENIKIYHLIVHSQQEEEARFKRKNRDAKRERSFDKCSSNDRLDTEDRPRFKKRISNQVPFKLPNARNDWVSNPKIQNGRGASSRNKK